MKSQLRPIWLIVCLSILDSVRNQKDGDLTDDSWRSHAVNDLITVGSILDRLIEAGDKHAAIWALCEDLEDATSDVGLKVQDSCCPDHGGRVHPQADKLAHALVNELWMAQGCTLEPGLFRQRVWDCLHEVLSEETNGN